MPRLSIVTISFNQARFLRQAMDSVLGQDHRDVEYVVVDPGSTDGSRDIIAGYGSRVHKMVLEPDEGAADGLNKGFALATGEIFGFLNSDDEFLPGALRTVDAAFRRRPSADMISGCGFIVDEAGERTRRLVPTPLTVTEYLYGAATVFQQGTFFRRECFGKVGGFNVANRTSWDGELFLDMVNAGCRHEVIRDDLALFRIYPGSISGSGRAMDAYRADSARVFEKTLGRPPRRTDRMLGAALRASKLLRHPGVALERMRLT
jgi:glycosyltransferase involved in cell wall biosynthesis